MTNWWYHDEEENGNYEERWTDYLCVRKEHRSSLIFKDPDRLLVFLFSCLLIPGCVKCIVTGIADMNYLKLICEMKVMPV